MPRPCRRCLPILLSSLCSALAAAEACRNAQPLVTTQRVGHDAWFVHEGHLRLLSACGSGGVELWLHEGCDDEDGRPLGLVPCDEHVSLALHAPVGGQVHVRARGDGMLHAPLQSEWAGLAEQRQRSLAVDEAAARQHVRGGAMELALRPASPTNRRMLSDVVALPPPLVPSDSDPTVGTLEVLLAWLSNSSTVSLRIVGRIELNGTQLFVSGGQRVTLWGEEGATIDAVGRSRVLEVHAPPRPCALA